MATEPEPQPAGRSTRVRSLSPPGARRATVIGAGSFGTALAVLLARGGLRTTLQTRTAEQAATIDRERENRRYLPGVELPPSFGSSLRRWAWRGRTTCSWRCRRAAWAR